MECGEVVNLVRKTINLSTEDFHRPVEPDIAMSFGILGFADEHTSRTCQAHSYRHKYHPRPYRKNMRVSRCRSVSSLHCMSGKQLYDGLSSIDGSISGVWEHAHCWRPSCIRRIVDNGPNVAWRKQAISRRLVLGSYESRPRLVLQLRKVDRRSFTQAPVRLQSCMVVSVRVMLS